MQTIVDQDPYKRWRELTPEEAGTWGERAAFAAQKLGRVSGVADMGCGWMTLERYLAPGTRYVPVDLIARDHRTIVCDFNKEPPPVIGVPAAVCLGLLRHLFRPDHFMAALSRLYSRAIVSCTVTDAHGATLDRRVPGPINAFSTEQAEALFLTAGWQIDDVFRFNAVQVIWLLSAPMSTPGR
jgi:hypothetical protein